MDAKTRAALDASIRHWEDNVAAETPGDVLVGIENCALCKLFISKVCYGCPVVTRTRGIACSGTPYHKAVDALDYWRYDPENDDLRDDWRAKAQAEVDFLKSRLPKDENEAR